jgi:hypothetical protein
VRRLAVVAAALLAATGVAAPVQAAVPEHLTMSFDEDPAITPVDGLGPGCPAFSGTLSEYRHLDLAGTVLSDGTVHGRTLVTATVTLTPDDPGAPSYAGGYTSRQTGFFTDGGDDDRVVTTTTHGVITGTDGSSYRISEVVHFSVDAQGNLRAWFDRFRCR